LIILAGPTTSGKSDAAVELAEHLDGEIINADSMQVYRYFDIGTAKPDAEARLRVPHHLIDILEPDEEFNAFDFKTRALVKIADLQQRGKTPVMAGGTGLYLKVLTENHDCAVQVSEATRKSVREQMDRDGLAACYEELGRIDPPTAARVTPADRLRIERALAVHRETGKKLSDFHAAEKPGGHEFPIHIFLFEWDRTELYENINRRVDRMIDSGWVDEVKGLLARGVRRDFKPMKSIGYAELVRHLDGEITLERAVYEIKRETRHYAKRQITWFKKMAGIQCLPADRGDTARTMMEKILRHLPTVSCLLWALILVAGLASPGLAQGLASLGEGAAWLKEGRAAAAENRFQNLLHTSRDRQMKKRARYLLGHATWAQGKFDEAGRLLAESLTDYPEIGDYIRLDLARLALAKGDGPQALEATRALLDQYPDSVLAIDAQLLSIDIFEKEGAPKKAIEALTTLLGEPGNPSHPRSLGPRLPELMARLARLHQSLGQNGQAYQWLRHLHIAYPADPAARETQADYRKLASMADVIPHPLSMSETDRRVRNLMNRARYEEALADMDDLMRQQPDLPDDFTFYRARAYQRTGQRPLAGETFDRFIRENPKHPRLQEALFEKGKNLWNLNRDREALETLREVLRKNKVSDWAMRAQFVISRIHESNREYRLAARHYRKLIERYPRGQFVHEAAWRLGWIHYQKENYADAHRRFEENARRYPRGDMAASNMYWAGKAAEKMGAAKTAGKIYQRLGKLHPFSFFALRARENLARLELPEDSGGETPNIVPIAFDGGLTQASPLERPLAAGEVFHLSRAQELIALGFYPLARSEIARIERPLFRSLSGVMRLSALYNAAQSHPDALRVLQIYKNSLSPARLRALPEAFWKNYYPAAYGEIIGRHAKDRGIDPFFVNSLIRQESLFDPRALSPAGARGLMQIMPETGRKLHGKVSADTPYDSEILYDPEVNIDLGILYLRQLTEEFGGEKAHLLISYNAGPHVLKKWLKRFESIDDPDMFIESIPYPETRNYVKRVMGNYGIYKILYPPTLFPPGQ